MDEYIKRETVKKMLENAQIISDGEYSGYCTEDINVDDIPAEDVAPVVRGKWIEHIDGYENYCECSVCHYIPDAPLDETPRCPSCGAKMREAR